MLESVGSSAFRVGAGLGSGGGARITIKKDIGIGDIPSCHILFISEDQVSDLPAILQAARKAPVLTVSEITNFAGIGGIVEFSTIQKNIGVFSKNKVNLVVNLKAAEKSNLKFDPQLLEIAAQVVR